jgi:VIT1/CCC1 family predicted Fe2+/Mn2+ transporter
VWNAGVRTRTSTTSEPSTSKPPDHAARWGAGHEPRGFRPLAQHYLRDLVYGANDGIITTFAVVAGAKGAELAPRIVLILGFANLLGDGFSMGASNFLAIRSDEAVRSARGLERAEPFPLRHALATFGAFFVAGTIPLVSYVFSLRESAFGAAVLLTMTTLFVVGAARSVVIDTPWYRSGLEMLLVGSLASGVAYAVGDLVSRVTS